MYSVLWPIKMSYVICLMCHQGNADVNLPTPGRRLTALHLACLHGYLDVVQRLLEAGRSSSCCCISSTMHSIIREWIVLLVVGAIIFGGYFAMIVIIIIVVNFIVIFLPFFIYIVIALAVSPSLLGC